jgi:PUA-domain protein
MAKRRMRKRKPVRLKVVRRILDSLKDNLEIKDDFSDVFLEIAEFGELNLLLGNRTPLVMTINRPEDLGKIESVIFPTLRGLLRWNLEIRWCAVDRGAIPFLMNGADCMAAGVQMVDPNIERGDLIWIRDEEHGKPIAIGWALLDAQEMNTATKGKALRTIHWIGDDLWEIEN